MFKKKKDDFSSKMISLIERVINKRRHIHLKYEILIKKLSRSDRPTNIKLTISRYIMHRILRESDRIFIKAQIKANSICPFAQDSRSQAVIHDKNEKTYH